MQDKKSILIVCPFPEGAAAGQRLKYEQYLKHWQENGYEITISSFMDMSMWKIVYTPQNYVSKILGTFRGHCRRLYDVFRIRRYDLVYIFMWVTPFGSTFFERLYRLLSKSIVYDIEDNFLEQQKGLNSFIMILKGPRKAKYLIKNSDYVISSSPFLNDYCLDVNLRKASTFISSSVNTKYFTPKKTFNNKKKVTIGWTGTFSSKRHLDLIRDVFFELNKRIDFKLRVISNFQYDLPGIDIEVIQWTKRNEVKDLQGIDIGIYPLVQDEWVLGKSGLKAIQYMAFGLPTVATNYGTTPTIIEHMKNGWLVNTHNEWVAALEKLIKDPKLRQVLGKAARLTVKQKYSTDVIKSTYINILNKVTGRKT